MKSDYEKYRGKCKEMSLEEIKKDPSLTLVRGHYDCPLWGKQQHWWCQKIDGTIIDPTVKQFPSNGVGEYIPFDGICKCSECDKEFPEEHGRFESNYCFCSCRCHGKFIGVIK